MSNPTTLVARTPVDLVTLVPHLLGFMPDDSMVFLTFGGGSGPHARVDMPHDMEGVNTLIDYLDGAVHGHIAGRQVVLILFTDDAYHAEQLSRLFSERFHVDLIDAMRVHEGWVHSALDPDLPSFRYVASEIADGLTKTPLASEAELEASVRVEPSQNVLDLLAAEPYAVHGTPRQDAEWVRDRLRDASPLDDGELVRLDYALRESSIRDVALALLTRGAGWRELWRDLQRRLSTSVHITEVAAFAAWLDGDGALAWRLIERAEENNSGPTELTRPTNFTRLLGQMLNRAADPRIWEQDDVDDLPIFNQEER